VQAIEKLAENVQRIKTLLSQLCTDLQETEFPNDVVQTETLRSDHRATRREFEEDLESTIHHGEALRDCLADVSAGDGESSVAAVKHRTELRLDRLEHVDAVDRSVGSLPPTVALSVCLSVCLSRLSVCLFGCLSLYVCYVVGLYLTLCKMASC